MKDLALHARALFHIRLNPTQLGQFERYEQELLAWNARFNLTAIREVEKIRLKHFLDSLSCACVLREGAPERLIDVGTGAGFPGLPLKIWNPALRLTLVESVGKKLQFCQHVSADLGLEGVTTLQARAEVLGQQPPQREAYDVAVARAVAILPVLAEYLLPLVRVGGTVIAMKGESAPAEVHTAEHALRVLGGRVQKLLPVTLPGVAEERYLVVIEKVAATPPNYPRRPGIPAKLPL
jgi:16S rRNA (guanine527-N7)-methyltransferase